MEIKKSPKADLESKKTVFMQIGLVVVLSLVLIAFEWTTMDVNINLSLQDQGEVVEEEIVPITLQEDIPPPPPPPPPVISDVLNIVEDDVELDLDLEILDTEMDQNTQIDFSAITFDDEVRDSEIFMIVEEMPEFPGGDAALQRYLSTSIRYPVIAQENGIQGRVYIRFVINQNGEVTNAEILRGVDASVDREALRVVQAMPKWKPGRQRNRAVRVSYTVPINFVLQN
jgi:periplasmic protein TonB